MRPTVCVTGRWAGVDNAWEQKKPETRKMLENGDESHLSSARFVGRPHGAIHAGGCQFTPGRSWLPPGITTLEPGLITSVVPLR